MKSTQLVIALLGRELRERYLSTFAGLAWVLITPVMLLGIYAFVFVQLLGARFGSRVGGDVLAFLALGMWPWHAFADSLARGTSGLLGNATLIGQIAIPRAWLVLVPTMGAALIHTVSFALVLIMLWSMGRLQPGPGWLLSLVAYLLIIVNAAAMGLILAPLNVFFRDVGTLLPQILTFWMLLTPIFFDRSLLRADLGEWLALNPMSGLIEVLRAGLLQGQADPQLLIAPAAFTCVMVALAALSARRFLARIEDFL